MKNKKIRIIATVLLTIVSLCSYAIPKATNHLVNDYANVFTDAQEHEMEQFLIRLNDSTSNQICVVTTDDLEGMPISQYATELGQKWSVGSKKFDNGVVLVIKPKRETNGDVFISVGYGLEGALPDILCKKIVDNILIPAFKRNDYYGGARLAVENMAMIVKGEYNEPIPSKDDPIKTVFMLIIFCGMIYVFAKYGSNNNSYTSYGGGSHSYYGGFNKTYGEFNSRDFGDFGGFGGGSFGGGGAGGRW